MFSNLFCIGRGIIKFPRFSIFFYLKVKVENNIYFMHSLIIKMVIQIITAAGTGALAKILLG